MKKRTGRLMNDLEARQVSSESERVCFGFCKEQIMIIPSIGILFGGYPYKFRVGFAFGPWLFSVGFYNRRWFAERKRRFLVARAMFRHRKEHDCRQKRRRIAREVEDGLRS